MIVQDGNVTKMYNSYQTVAIKVLMNGYICDWKLRTNEGIYASFNGY
jgi:hypothetical protein